MGLFQKTELTNDGQFLRFALHGIDNTDDHQNECDNAADTARDPTKDRDNSNGAEDQVCKEQENRAASLVQGQLFLTHYSQKRTISYENAEFSSLYIIL